MIKPKKLVCIFAHPDDEAFGPGGTLAKFAKEGVETYLVCVTCGDAIYEYAKGNDLLSLKQVRRKELEASAKILGIKKVFFLDFADGSLSNNNYHQVVQKLESIISQLKPDTLMTFAQNGVTGHLDHIAVAMQASYVYEKLPFIKNIMYYCEKKEAKQKIGSDYFIYFPDGYSSKEADWVIDVKMFVDAKKQAMFTHKSQLSDVKMFVEHFGELMGKEYFKLSTK